MTLLACRSLAGTFSLLYRLTAELRDFFLGSVPESQWLRHCLHDWMPSVILFPIYLCEQHLPLLSRFLCGSGRGSSLGLSPSCVSPADRFWKGTKPSLEPLTEGGCPVLFKWAKESGPDEETTSAHFMHHGPLERRWWHSLREDNHEWWVWKNFSVTTAGARNTGVKQVEKDLVNFSQRWPSVTDTVH